MIEPLFVPTTQTAVSLLETFRQARQHFALVVNEFGTAAGVVTIVDVLAAIVGNLPSLCSKHSQYGGSLRLNDHARRLLLLNECEFASSN